ncbi:MAG: hypothetical protein WCT42_02305 [Candidatus Paceibacterota bacterium]
MEDFNKIGKNEPENNIPKGLEVKKVFNKVSFEEYKKMLENKPENAFFYISELEKKEKEKINLIDSLNDYTSQKDTIDISFEILEVERSIQILKDKIAKIKKEN